MGGQDPRLRNANSADSSDLPQGQIYPHDSRRPRCVSFALSYGMERKRNAADRPILERLCQRRCAPGSAITCGRVHGEVHYEDLVLDTRGSLQKVCDFLDEPFEENMLEFHLDVSDKIAPWEQEFHTKTMRAPKSSDVGRWRKEMTTLQLATLEYVAGKTMEQTGQNRFYNGAGSLIPLGVGLGYWAADVSLPIRRALGIHFPHLRRKL